jgi:hypothetical protein
LKHAHCGAAIRTLAVDPAMKYVCTGGADGAVKCHFLNDLLDNRATNVFKKSQFPTDALRSIHCLNAGAQFYLLTFASGIFRILNVDNSEIVEEIDLSTSMSNYSCVNVYYDSKLNTNFIVAGGLNGFVDIIRAGYAKNNWSCTHEFKNQLPVGKLSFVKFVDSQTLVLSDCGGATVIVKLDQLRGDNFDRLTYLTRPGAREKHSWVTCTANGTGSDLSQYICTGYRDGSVGLFYSSKNNVSIL